MNILMEQNPAHAGMNPPSEPEPELELVKPRTCGDEPQDTNTTYTLATKPRTCGDEPLFPHQRDIVQCKTPHMRG